MDDRVRATSLIADPMRRAKTVGELLAEFENSTKELSRVRREALEELVARGLTHAQIGDGTGLSRARVGQLLSSGPKPERIFLGTGPLTVALGGKLEAKKVNPGPVVAQEDFYAYGELQSLAKGLSLETQYEVIPPPGILDLNRDNLIVICGPRISPIVAQVLMSDYNIGFERDDQGWYLIDRVSGELYRSPMDSGQSSDYAYLGRLPRLDGKGNFLYIAGIHAVGAAGVVHFLDHHLAELYKETKVGRFSTVIQCSFDPENRHVKESRRVTPIYRPDGAA